jgi:hypothetical protein
MSCKVWDSAGAGASGPAPWGLPCLLIGVVVEVVMMSPLPFWPCFLSSSQANQKHCACGPPLAEQEVWLATGNYTNETPHLATGSHLHSQEKRKSKCHSGLS